MTQVKSYAPKRGNSGKINILGEELDKIQSPVVAFGSATSPGTVMNAQLIKADLPAGLPNGVHLVKLTGTVNGSPFEQVLGGYTVGPPVSGLLLDRIYPDVVPAAGGSTIYLLGNGFLSEGRAANPTVKFGASIARPSVTQDDAVIEVANIPSANDLRVMPGQAVPVEATFSDGQSVIGALIYM